MNTLSASILNLTHNQLSNFASLDDFWTLLDTAFGTEYDQTAARNLRSQWLTGNFSQLPQIEILDSNILGNAYGAYANSTNTIYLSSNFVGTATPEVISAVLLEEIGHFVDAQINQQDTPGDEGEHFSALVRGQNLSIQNLERIKTENDWTNLTVQGEQLAVEQATPIVLNVNTTVDQNDGSTANGLSLRDAILIANADTTNDYIIELQGGQTYSLSIKNTASLNDGGDEQAAVRGDLDILSGGKITIKSVGTQKAIIDATNLKTSFASGFGDSAIDVKDNAYLILDGVTVTGASIGAVWIGNNGTAEISNSLITNNEITVASAFYEVNQDGSGITNYGTLLLKDSIISNNKAARYGGGIFSIGTATITNTTISGNTANQFGGGILTDGTATITNTTISGNTTNQNGGGIWNIGTATITNTTISGNTANQDGGGIENIGTATITNTTISGNTANQDGGGIFSSKSTSATVTGKIYLNNSTITNNTADLDSNNNGSGGGIYNVNGAGEVYAKNTIIAGNFDTPNNNGGGSASNVTYNPDIKGSINGNNYNLIGNKTGVSGTIGTGTDIVNPKILLGTLQNNGGSTQTHALLNGSPAINAGNNSLIPLDTNDVDGDGNTTETIPFDQRGTGFSRISNNLIDIGAFEVQGIPLPAMTINNISVIEGNSGTKTGTVTVNLNAVTDKTVTVNYTTANNTAISGIDYTATSGQLSFAPGETTKTISVNILGDSIAETNENFFVNLSNATNAMIDPTAGSGIVTITDDEPYPIPNPAITLTVNTTTDQNDGSATNGLSLRDAILIANANTTNDYIIQLQGGQTYYLGTNISKESLNIQGNATIRAVGNEPAIIDGRFLTEQLYNYLVGAYLTYGKNIFRVHAQGNLTLDNITVTNAMETAINIESNASVLMQNSTVSHTFSILSGEYSRGIENSGTLTLQNSIVYASSTIGIINYGGATAIILDSVIRNNNSSGIRNEDNATLNLINTAIVYNTSSEGAGLNNSGTANLINTTISNNTISGSGYSGGGIDNDGILNLFNSTIANNTATSGGGIYSHGGGQITLKNTIIAGNIANSGNDIYGSVTGNNNNLIGNLTGASGTVGTGTDIVNPIPKLGVLQDNGNGIFTHALLSGSPAINQGNNALIATDVFDLDADGNNTENIPFDNRGSGFTRISGGTVDIGAFEFQPNAPSLSLSINDVTLTEGNSGTKNATFTVTLSGETFQPVTVNYATANGTATAGSDYTATTGTLIFNVNPGETSKTISVPILGDTLFEENETFFLNLSNAVNALIADNQGIGTITNDDFPSVIVTATDANAAETATGVTPNPGVFTLTRTGSITNSLTVNYTLTGTATNSTDYTIPTSVTFAAGSSTATVAVNPIDDSISEPAETAILTLATGTGYTIGTTASATVNIADNEPPIINLSPNQTIVEGFTSPQNATYTVSLSNSSTQAITVNYATANGTAIAGSDYTSTTGTLTFNPGVTSQVINIPIVNNSVNEANETFTLKLTNPTNASLGTTNTVTTTITDTLAASVTTTLPDNVENLTLTGTAAINGTGNALSNNIKGNTGNNTLTGGAGNDTLNGGAGADTMIGGVGNDIYYVDNAGDITTEALNEGTDTVQSNITWTLADNVENLTLTGTAAINGTGNALSNSIKGNTGNNTLTGGAGNDTLNGGAGADTMIGGVGNDTYIVDNAGDITTEALNEGTDTVQSNITWAVADNLENLTLTGTAAINGTGNALNNTITGNAAANMLTGGSGIDTLTGMAGNDILVGGFGNDILTGGTGADGFRFNNANEGVDIITDFTATQGDIIQILATGFGGGLAAGTLASEMFFSGAGVSTPTNSSQRFIYNTSNGGLFFDADGNGSGFATTQIATLTGAVGLSNTNIAVI